MSFYGVQDYRCFVCVQELDAICSALCFAPEAINDTEAAFDSMHTWMGGRRLDIPNTDITGADLNAVPGITAAELTAVTQLAVQNTRMFVQLSPIPALMHSVKDTSARWHLRKALVQ